MDAVLGDCSLDRLRKRKSFKWRTSPSDVLPAFVAEMDFDLAKPVTEAVTAALALGDAGYPQIGELGEVFAAFARKRLRWVVDPVTVFAIPDVMTVKSSERVRFGRGSPRWSRRSRRRARGS